MSTSSPTIPAEIARHVLWHYGKDGGHQPGSFTQRLMEAFAAADMVNTAKLANAYPDYAAAFIAANLDPDGITNLQRIAQGDMSTEEPPAPQCPEALFNPDTGDLLRCIQDGRHNWHETPGGTQWRTPVDTTAEVPF
ncbi:hypothetical protein ACWDBD_17025 [Streptomyces sp. NPDC001118]